MTCCTHTSNLLIQRVSLNYENLHKKQSINLNARVEKKKKKKKEGVQLYFLIEAVEEERHTQ